MQESPRIRGIFRLRCPYCLETHLLQPGSWFEFNEGCRRCGYRFEREEGYFLGAPWMISYPLIGAICLAVAVFTYPLLAPRFGMTGLAVLISITAIVTGLLFYPYARAIWMVGDHLLHPLNPEELTWGKNT